MNEYTTPPVRNSERKGKSLKDLLLRVLHMLTHNLGYKIVSLILAMGLWAGLISQDATLTREKILTDVTASLTGGDTMKRNGYIVTSSMDGVLSGLTVRASVPQLQYQTAQASNYNVRLDLSRVRSTGTQTVKYVWTNSAAYGSVQEVIPASAEVTVDEYITRFRIPLVLETVNQPPEGWYATSATLDPPLIAISGPRELLETVARAEAVMDLSELPEEEGTILTLVPFTLVDSRGRAVDTSLIEVTSESVLLDSVIVEQALYPEKTLAFSDEGLLVGTPAEGYEVKSVTISPETVVAAGPSDTLQELSDIFAQTQVDVSGKSESFNQAIKLRKPSELVYVSQDSVTVAVTIGSVIATRSFQDLRVNIAYSESGRSVSLGERYATVQVTGPKNWLDNLKASQIRLTVDPSGLEDGDYNLDIQCAISDSETVEYTAQVIPATVATSIRTR